MSDDSPENAHAMDCGIGRGLACSCGANRPSLVTFGRIEMCPFCWGDGEVEPDVAERCNQINLLLEALYRVSDQRLIGHVSAADDARACEPGCAGCDADRLIKIVRRGLTGIRESQALR